MPPSSPLWRRERPDGPWPDRHPCRCVRRRIPVSRFSALCEPVIVGRSVFIWFRAVLGLA